MEIVKLDINRPYEILTQEIYSHELNYGGSKILYVEFWEENSKINLSDITITASITVNDCIIADNVAVTKSQNVPGRAYIDISANSNYSIPAGLMKIEFKLANGSQLLYPVPIVEIEIVKSILTDAQVTPESYGTVSEIVQEVATARSSYSNLNSRFTADEDNIAILQNKFPIDTSDIKDDAVTSGKIGGGEVKTTNIDDDAVNTQHIADGAITPDQLDTGAVTVDKIDGGAVDLSKINPSAYESTPTKGSAKLLTSGGAFTNLMKYADATGTPFDNLLTESKIFKTTVSNIDYYCWIMNNTQFRCSIKGLEYRIKTNDTWSLWYYAIDNESISFPKLSSGTVSTSVHSSQEWAYADNRHIPTPLLVKNWILNQTDDKLIKSTKVIGFDTDDCVSFAIAVLPQGQPNNKTKSIYVPSSITAIPNSILSISDNLDTLYIDNNSADVTISSTVTSALTVKYKDEFNLADLLVNSQKNLNDRLTALETTVGQANTIIENALKGVS